MRGLFKLNTKYVFEYSQGWGIPLIMTVCLFVFFSDLRESDIKYPLLGGAIVVMFPSLYLFINYLCNDWNKIVYIDKSRIEQKKNGQTTIILKSEIKEVIHIESSYKESKSYGGLYFLGGEFSYTLIKYKFSSHFFSGAINIFRSRVNTYVI
ncbi:hypothetical protein KDU71_16105, partial [Carboxylicivirga sediminis]